MKTWIIIRSNFLLTKEKYFSNINVKSISENTKLRKAINLFFSNKGLNMSNIMLVENNEIVWEEEIIANNMNNYFASITTHLKLKPKSIESKSRKYNNYLPKLWKCSDYEVTNFHFKPSFNLTALANLTSR